MGKRSRLHLTALAVVVAGFVSVAPSLTANASSPITLLLSQNAAFGILGHWCGGIQEKSFATGFDTAAGYPAGDVYMSTRCNGSGRGGHSTLYQAWASVMWDFTGVVVTDSVLAAAPSTDPTFTAYDSHQNELYNTATYAYLQLAPGYVPVPRVTAISATSGSAAGGTAVTIYGTGFTGATAVTFGSVTASYTVVNDNEITTVSPPQPAGTVAITVTTPGGPDANASVAQFTYIAIPVVKSISPHQGPVTGGTPVTITGTGFTNATSVTFDGIWAQFVVDSDTTITATSPAGENPDNITVQVTTEGGTSSIGFTYTPPVSLTPAIKKVKPGFGPRAGGTAVTIVGAKLGGVTAVMFGAKPAKSFVAKSATSIVARSPSGSKTVNIRITTGYGTTAVTRSDRFTYRK